LSREYSKSVSRLICVMVLLLLVRCLGAAAYRAAVAPGGLFTGDFALYYAAAQRLDAGQTLYIPEHGARLLNQHVSSPLIPLIVRPLSRFPLVTATRMWAAINVTLLTAAAFLFCWGIGLRIPEDTVSMALVLLCGFRFWPTTIELGIANSQMLLLMLIGGMFVCARHEKWLLFGALAAVAVLTKTWMLGILFYPVFRRKWAATAGGFGFLAAGLVVLFTSVGWQEWGGWMATTHRYSSQPELVSNSVAGIARMYFTKNLVLTPLADSRVCWAIVLVLGYGFLLGGLGYLWWRGGLMSEVQRQMTLALMPLALVLASPVSHQFYFVLALPVLWLLLVGQGHGWRLRVAAFCIYLLMSVPYAGLNPVGMDLRHGLKSLLVGESFYCGMTLWAMGLFVALPRIRKPRHGSLPAPSARPEPVMLAGVES